VKISPKVILIAALLATSIWLPKASAASSQVQVKPPTGVTISPAFQQAGILATEQQHPITFKITNNETKARTFDLSVADFNTLGESGGLFFVGTNPTELQKKYGLAKWFSLQQKSITLQPKQSETITAEILNLPDLSPGGHYGALMLQADNPGQSGGNNQVSVHPIASSLLFVTKVGGDTHELSLASVSFKRTLFSIPSSVELRFQNKGNSHVVPRGNVYIKTAAGKVMSKGIINEDSNIILPETYRIYNVPLSSIGGLNASGQYQLHVDFRFDGIDTYRAYQQNLLVIQPWTILAALVLVVGSVVGLYYVKKTKK